MHAYFYKTFKIRGVIKNLKQIAFRELKIAIFFTQSLHSKIYGKNTRQRKS